MLSYSLGRRARFGALTQSVFPAVFTTKLPSLPSKVLPGRLACAGSMNAELGRRSLAGPPLPHLRSLLEPGLFEV